MTIREIHDFYDIVKYVAQYTDGVMDASDYYKKDEIVVNKYFITTVHNITMELMKLFEKGEITLEG